MRQEETEYSKSDKDFCESEASSRAHLTPINL